MNDQWLTEPSTIDDTWANYNEHTLEWLSRSTLPRAKQMRFFLNHNLSLLPKVFSNKLKHDLKHRWRTAFFELILARLLQEVGLIFEHEKILPNGKKPDFLVETSYCKLVIEATSPIINSDIGKFYNKKVPLIELIQKHTPENWIVNIEKLPEIGFNDSKKDFKNYIKNEFAKISNTESIDDIYINKQFSAGNLELTLIFKQNRINPIGFLPAVGYAENSKYRILHSINEKREQIKDIDIPVFLAIQGSNTGTDLNDFNQVLFGNAVTRLNNDRIVEETLFEANGEFVGSNKNSTLHGILAFPEVGFKTFELPTLYLNQQADLYFFEVFDFLNIRYYEQSQNKIKEVKPHRVIDLNNFNFVTF